MIKPTPEHVKAMREAMRHYPDLRNFVETWYNHEMKELPNAVNHAALYQGRCQVLGELKRFVDQALDPAAKSS